MWGRRTGKEMAVSHQFERINETIGPRAVAITSWYDDAAQQWRASAPRYSHLDALDPRDQPPSASRRAAIAWVVAQLSRHFAAEARERP